MNKFQLIEFFDRGILLVHRVRRWEFRKSFNNSVFYGGLRWLNKIYTITKYFFPDIRK